MWKYKSFIYLTQYSFWNSKSTSWLFFYCKCFTMCNSCITKSKVVYLLGVCLCVGILRYCIVTLGNVWCSMAFFVCVDLNIWRKIMHLVWDEKRHVHNWKCMYIYNNYSTGKYNNRFITSVLIYHYKIISHFLSFLYGTMSCQAAVAVGSFSDLRVKWNVAETLHRFCF